jgi:Cu/Ag efflux protein CusF
MRRIISVVAVATMLVSPAFAQPAAQPAAKDAIGAADVVVLRAKIEAVDAATRMVTVKGQSGKVVKIHADDRVKNFAQIKAGDDLVLKYVDAVSIALVKTDAGRSAVTTTTSATAPPGSMPAAAAAKQTKVVASVVSVDPKTSHVVLEGPNANYVEVKVKDPAVMANVKAGDKVEATFTEAVLIEVTTPAK